MHKSVAFLINNLGVGGAENVFVSDANALCRAGYRVTFFMLYSDERDQVLVERLDQRIERVLVRARGPFDFFAVYRIVARMRESSTRHLFSTLNDANIIARWCVLWSLGHVILFMREANDPRTKPRWQTFLDLLFNGLCRRILAVSCEVGRATWRMTPWRRHKVLVLRNSVDLMPQSMPAPGPLRLVTIASLSAQKDHATLLDALAALKSLHIAFTARLVGGGVLEDGLRNQAARLGLNEVVFLGRLPHEKAMEELAKSDVFMLTSRWEGCPNAVLEAMAHGVPVVATSVGGVRELVKDGVQGLLVPVGDAKAVASATASLADPVRRVAMGANARSTIEREYCRERRLEKLKALILAA